MNENPTLFDSEQAYLSSINDFYKFYKTHHYCYPKQFINYLSNHPFKYRLCLIEKRDEWTLLKVSKPFEQFNAFMNKS